MLFGVAGVCSRFYLVLCIYRDIYPHIYVFSYISPRTHYDCFIPPSVWVPYPFVYYHDGVAQCVSCDMRQYVPTDTMRRRNIYAVAQIKEKIIYFPLLYTDNRKKYVGALM